MPPPTRLTTILKPQQNLASIRNPVGVWGGADAEQPQDVRDDAPKSVLTFGRAISGDDYETVAALAPSVARARAYWTWDATQQRCGRQGVCRRRRRRGRVARAAHWPGRRIRTVQSRSSQATPIDARRHRARS